ncbi:MAG: DUF11 domain-containing protein, partial [bacterium]|nr:DUF11 domain-containing protein [bacterium]
GDWLDPGEDLFPGGQAIEMGLTSLGFAVPATAVAGTTTARFRCTTGGAVSFSGLAADGEVEDYQVTVEAALDFGDAPVVWNGGGFATLGSLAARHVLAGGVYLGACVDAETGGQAVDVTPGGDDANAGPRIDGTCTGGDDEDGVVFTTPLIPDQTANVDVTAAATCNLSAWIDWNSDGDWNDGGEKVFNDEALGAGINALSVPVPAGAAIGTAWARFRCTTAAGVNYYSQAADGEVEDYALTIGNPVDFGDAPDPSYPTLAASSGASHLLDGTVYLGLCVDAESDGQPSAAAAGDDLGAGNPVFGTCAGVSDEDGVVFTSLLTGGSSADVDVTASAACTLSAWIDFNHNGDFSDAEDDLFVGGTLLSAGVNNLTFPVPAGAVAGITVARFRCTTDGAVSFTGQAGDGEVEDHLVEITGIDYGDAPDPTYPTYLANDGARHLLGGLTFLGGCVDADLGGQPSAGADGDDLDAGGLVAGSCVNDDDEDGVLFLEPLAPGTNVDVDVLAAAPCTLSAWIDWNGDGDWIDTGEELFPGGAALGFGSNLLSVAVPGAATPGTTFARFRCTTDGPVAFTGPATDGEVEDYQVTIGDALDFGDAPDPAYPTLAAADGARHVLGSGVYLGFCVDAEADGQQSADVLGDDTGVGSPIFGACAGNDDEDGVTFTTLLVTDTTADVVVRASAACTLSAWIDFDQSGGWTAGEELFPGGVALAAGLNPLSFSVPAAAAAGTTAARFRCTTDGAVSYTGQAADGEVEDYEVSISDLDYGDAPDPFYPTLLASGGARHVVTGGLVFLGECVDAEADAQPTATADGDDTAVGDPVVLYPDVLTCDDDEDGVTFTTPLYADTSAGVTVHVNDPCTLSAWIDWNGDGDWDDPGEDLFPGGEFLEVTTNLSFEVPADAAGGTTFARFRCTTDGPVTPTGLATDGEVEDYEVEVPAPIDWGDAQDSPYPTLEASDGARHVLGSGVYLGECVDAEVDGQEHASFRRDDQWTSNFVVGNCTHGDDEDGVKFTSLLLVDETADVEVTASAACTLSAWIDWNADGDWDEPDEELFPGGRALTAGLNTLSVTVPATAPTGETGARFRCTTDGPVSYTGQASDGEVEDYRVPIGATTDYGDAPDPTYPTLEASSGASHLIGDLYLGSCVDGESDGLPNDAATGDDVNDGIPVFGDCTGNDDEDGVVFKSLLVADQTADFEVTASGPCNLTAWIDWNRDGDWGEANEELFPGGTALAAGLNPLSVSVPSGAGTGDTYARFRCTTDGAAPITGQAADGEVEDYKVTLGDVPDFGDARSPYPTRFADGGAFHLLGSGVYLGACVDAETDGQRDNNAEGDDENAGNPVFGTCVDGDDEDGVVFITALTIGATADIEVTASADCTLSAWIDWNGDGDWSEADEELFPPDGVALSAGLNPLSFAVPDAGGEIAETTYARFRCTTDGSVHFTGEAADGEVEDYRVTLEPPNADLSITKTGSSGAVMPGATLTYTIAVTNAGPLAAPDVQVTDTLPEEGVSFLSTSGCAEDPAGVPVCSLGTIEAAGEKQYTITVEIMSPSTGGIITNVANVESAIEDPDPENNQAIEDTLIDLDPPTVTQVAAGAEIVECGEVRSALSALLVSFSEPMLDPPDDVDPDDVTNPANYLLVAAGPDQDFSTSFCGPALDDDEAIAIDLVTYDDVTLTATLDLAGSLNDSLYRLLVCGSTSIRDLAGYLLDGTGNGIGGDDFVRTWRVERGNILSNGYFDCTLDSWVGVSTVPEEIAHSPDDFDDSSASGSAQVTNLSASIDFSLGQCVDVNLPSVPFCPFEARVRLDAEPGVSLLLSKTCEFFSETACAGFSMASNSTLSFIADTAGGWEIVGFSIRPPEAAASALCSFDLSTPTAEDFNIYYDEVRLTCASLIFEDGFESGDTSQWSSAVP